MSKRAILFGLVLVITNTAIAAPRKIPVRLIIIKGPGAITESEAVRDFKIVRDQAYREMRQRLYLLSVATFPEQSPEIPYTLATAQAKFDSYVKRFTRRVNPPILIHIQLPPIVDQERIYFGGFSRGICTYRRADAISASFGSGFHARGPADKLRQATLKHELFGHQAGAHHDGEMPATIMHPDALAYVLGAPGQSLPFSWFSRLEINACNRTTRKTRSAGFVMDNEFFF